MKGAGFWNSPTAHIVRRMKETGNRPGIVRVWKDGMEEWAKSVPDNIHKQAVRAWLPQWIVRPFYSSEELAPIIPALSLLFGYETRWGGQKSPNRLANELEFAGLPLLENASGGFVFMHPGSGRLTKFFVVEQLHHWRDHPLTQREFEEFFR